MSLKLYYKNSSGSYVEVSSGDTITSPIPTTHDAKNGDTKVTCLYLHNDGTSTKWYSNIAIRPDDIDKVDSYSDVAYDETGWGIRLSPGSTEPTDSEWDDIDWGSDASMSDVGSDSAADVATYYPVWYLITCPPNTDAQNKTDIILKVLYTENAVS